MKARRPLLVSGDSDLIDDVLRLAAANAIEVHLATDAESARGHWQLAPLVIVGADAGPAVASSRMSRRRDVVVVTRTPSAEVWECAVALGAEHVVALPDAERWLIDRLADSGEGPTRGGRVVAIVGAGGGAGASTFAATLAVVGAARSLRVLLVDADPTGGGLDVLLGIEDVAGVRWPDLAETRGRIGSDSLGGALPVAQGAAVLSWGRSGAVTVAPEALSAVLEAGVRGYDLVIVDTPRHRDTLTDTVLSHAREALLVTTNRVRSVSAAARILDGLRARCAATSLVLREAPKGVLDDAVLAALDAPVVARLPASNAVAARADNGEPPAVRDAYGRACLTALHVVAEGLERAA